MELNPIKAVLKQKVLLYTVSPRLSIKSGFSGKKGWVARLDLQRLLVSVQNPQK
jgi:hypothetical protein